MITVTKITVSVPTSLLKEAERRLQRPDEGRSGLVRRLLEEALREKKEKEDIERYIRGYTEQPQTEEEWGWQHAL